MSRWLRCAASSIIPRFLIIACGSQLSRLVTLLIAVLSLLQGLQPLLHAHVDGAVHEARLVHFHAPLAVGVTHATLPALTEVRAADAPIITVGESFRRHGLLGWTAAPALSADAAPLQRAIGAPPHAPPMVHAIAGASRHRLPPALAPPFVS